MTDPDRRALLVALEEFGSLCQDMRFGQMIANLVTMAREPTSQAEWAEAVWDIEDGELLATTRERLQTWRRALDEEGHPSDPGSSLPESIPPADGERNPRNMQRIWVAILQGLEDYGDRCARRSSLTPAAGQPAEAPFWTPGDEALLASIKSYLAQHAHRPETGPTPPDSVSTGHHAPTNA